MDIFKLYFFKEFKKLKVTEREPIIKALPYIFRMWYYSALIDESPFSPVNLINSQISEEFGEGCTVVPKPIPVYKNRVLKDFQFEYRLFPLKEYPVLEDLRLLLEHSTPDVGIDEGGLLLEEERASLINSLSFNEIYYITYLTNLAYELKLLKKMPSIGVHRAMSVRENIKEFFKLSKDTQMKKLIDATIAWGSLPLLQMLPSDRKLISKEALIELFTSGHSLDEYLAPIFKRHQIDIDFEGLDIENLEDLQALELSEEDLFAAAINLDLSFIIDAYLTTPLGYYLQCLQPLYLNCFDFTIFFEQLLQAEEMNIPIIKLYFAMGNLFDLTYNGKRLMKRTGKTSENIQELKNYPDYEEIYTAILQYHSDEIDVF